MTASSATRMNRRELLGAAAAAAAWGIPAVAGAQAANEFPRRGEAVSGPGVPQPTPVVRTKSGPVQGLVEDGIHAFKGVRYGAPPTGRWRFMPPRAPEPWSGVYDATGF